MFDVNLSTGRLIELDVPATYTRLHSGIRASFKGHTSSQEPSDIDQAYKRSGGSLLILGQAGSGKTHSVARLVNRLVTQAVGDPMQPLPFYLDLSCWDGNQANFERWCITAISKEYGPKESLVLTWIEDDDIVLVLDGLDQLPRKLRTTCFTAINRFRHAHGLLSIIVVSREQEYVDSPKQLQLTGCLRIHPLSAAHVTELLANTGDAHRGLLDTVRNNRKLADLLRTPLFLVLALEAYRGVAKEEISKSGPSWNWSVINAYLIHAAGRISKRHVVDVGLHSWLPLLAAHLRRNHEPVFYPDRLPLSYVITYRSLQEDAARRSGLMAAGFITSVILLIRAPYLAAMFGDRLFVAYAGSSLGFIVALAFTARWMGQRAVKHPLTGGRYRTSKSWPRILVTWALAYSCLGSLAAATRYTSVDGLLVPIVWIGSILVGLYPGWVMMRSSEPDGERVPRYPGEENRSLLITSAGCAATAVLALYLSLFLVMQPISHGDPAFLPLPASILVTYFVVPFGIVIGLRNGGIDLIARYAVRQLAISRSLLPRRYFNTFDALRISSILVPRQGGYSFIHSLVRDQIAGVNIQQIDPVH